jgi:hypothetical protein
VDWGAAGGGGGGGDVGELSLGETGAEDRDDDNGVAGFSSTGGCAITAGSSLLAGTGDFAGAADGVFVPAEAFGGGGFEPFRSFAGAGVGLGERALA